MKIGTRSVLFGAHCFFLHPWFVAAAWWRLYGFPRDVRLWVAFFVHDLGYLGKPNMDGAEGETHPILGARIMGALFDWDRRARPVALVTGGADAPVRLRAFWRWGQFSLLHSRHYAKRLDLPYSRLCVADKLAFCLEPAWLYLPRVRATGELAEYMYHAATARGKASGVYAPDPRQWHANLKRYMGAWVKEHQDGRVDTWTKVA